MGLQEFAAVGEGLWAIGWLAGIGAVACVAVRSGGWAALKAYLTLF